VVTSFSFGDERPGASVAVPGGSLAPCGAGQRLVRGTSGFSRYLRCRSVSLAQRSTSMVRQQIPWI